MGEFEKQVLAAVPSIEALIPAAPAAALGRHEHTAATVREALERVPRLVTERLLGALELGVAKLELRAPEAVPLPRPQHNSFWYATGGEESATKLPVQLLENAHPGAAEMVATLFRDLVPIALGDVEGDEETIAARHGAAHLALAVAVSTALLRAIDSAHSNDPAAIIGVAIGATALLLPEIPKPPAYEQALLAKRREEYQFSHARTHVPVFGHEFLFVEELSPDSADFSPNGLVAAVDTGFAVRTGIAEGHVPVSVQVLRNEPDLDLVSWDDVVEVSYTAQNGGARLGHVETPPWPGEFRVRVHARGRDGSDDEDYSVQIWQAPLAEPVVHLKAGPRPPAPDAEHRWFEKELPVAATVTIVTGLSAAEVAAEFDEDFVVVETGDAVIVVENNNFAGSRREVLQRLSRNGKAASHFWNVNRVTRLSFARGGEVLLSEEPTEDVDFSGDQEVAAAVEGLDFENWHHKDAKGITAVCRFTGRAIPVELVRPKVQEMIST